MERRLVRAIHHVQLAMPAGAENRADALYAGVLGMPRIPKPPKLERRGGCWFGGDGFEVHLGVEEPFDPARKIEILASARF
ncbi:MAG: hypothetical protein ACXVPX_03475 [Actinomycetota bacterium]